MGTAGTGRSAAKTGHSGFSTFYLFTSVLSSWGRKVHSRKNALVIGEGACQAWLALAYRKPLRLRYLKPLFLLWAFERYPFLVAHLLLISLMETLGLFGEWIKSGFSGWYCVTAATKVTCLHHTHTWSGHSLCSEFE